VSSAEAFGYSTPSRASSRTINTTGEPRAAPEGEPVLATHRGEGLAAHAALIVRN